MDIFLKFAPENQLKKTKEEGSCSFQKKGNSSIKLKSLNNCLMKHQDKYKTEFFITVFNHNFLELQIV